MDEAKLELVRDWPPRASHDLGAACALSSLEHSLLDVAIYHCQQAAEKTVQGWLQLQDDRFPKTHDVADLVNQAANVEPGFRQTFRSLTEQIDASLRQERVVAMLSGFFGALALLLAGLGLYGVTSYAVSRRRTEIGIRMALGAAPGGVVRLVLARVTRLVAIGVAMGAAGSLWASKFVATLLYGLEPRDPLTLIGAAVVLGAVGAIAGWLPASRASRIDPAEVLRES